MHRKELNERSPLRILDASIHGGLGRGNVGVVIARHGVGKTPFLVGIALDDLMRGRKVVHVSLETGGEKVRAYYDEIFMDLAHTRELEDVWKVRLDLERNRRIHCYLDGTFGADKLREALGFMREHGEFVPATIVIDGYDFAGKGEADLDELRAIARETDAELWMSALTHRDAEVDDRGVPHPIADLSMSIDVILKMAHDTKAVHVSVLKDHDNADTPDLKIALDPTTMLVVRED